MAHHLGLSIDNTLTCSTLRISDASVYQVGQPILNALLEVTTPQGKCPIVFNVTSNFNVILNVNNLEVIQTIDFEKYSLSDGLYSIRYSINPNSKLFIETSYFRTCKINNLLNLKITELFENQSTIKKSEFQIRMDSLIEIEFQIKAAKYLAEINKDLKKSSALYNDANNKLKNIDNCSTC